MSPRLLQMVMVLIASLLVFSPGRSNAETLVTLPQQKCVFVPDGTYTYSYDISGNVDASSPNLVLSCSGAIIAGSGGRGYQGLRVRIEGVRGNIIASTATGDDGAFNFTKLPAGNHKLKLDGLPDQSLTVKADGIVGGNVMKGADGTISIFDRWGNLTAKAVDNDVRVRDNTFNRQVGVVPDGLAARTQGKEGGGGLLKPFEDLAVKHEQRMKQLDTRAQKIGGDIEKGERDPHSIGTGGGDGKLPGLALAGEPIPGVDVKLGKNPGGSIVASSQTDSQGNFHFDKLPAGKYKLSLPGHLFPSIIAVTVGADGSVIGLSQGKGSVMRGSDGTVSIFDRWGNSLGISVSKTDTPGSKAAGTPVGFGRGNTPGAGTGMGDGPGMSPGMSPAHNMGSPMGQVPGMGGGSGLGSGSGMPSR